MDVANNLKQIREVKQAFPVLGRYDVVLDLEAADLKNLNNVVGKISRMTGVVFTETLIEMQL